MPQSPDLNDNKPWSAMDLFDLRAVLEHGSSIEEAAMFLCRSGTIDDVARKAEEMGLPAHGFLVNARNKTVDPL